MITFTLYAVFGALMFGLLYTQTRQGPLVAILWLLVRIRAAFILFQWTARHVYWWAPVHWKEALQEARTESPAKGLLTP